MKAIGLVAATLERARRDRDTTDPTPARHEPRSLLCRAFTEHDPDPTGRCRDCGHTNRKRTR